jgi:hypothetical protein
MAEAAAPQAEAPPTFKLVLVGDGGTGKASSHLFILVGWAGLVIQIGSPVNRTAEVALLGTLC